MPAETATHGGGPPRAADPLQCLIPADLARLEPTMRRHGLEHGIEVILDRRRRERRSAPERRAAAWPAEPTEPVDAERRRVRNTGGRRVGERRATLIPVASPATLPRRAQAYAERLLFVERLDLGDEAREDLDTARIVTRWQAGDRAAFSDIYERYFDRVYSYLRVALNDSHEAEDATQQVFIQMMEALGRYELRSTPVRGWLFRIVRNHAISHARRSGRMRVEEPTTLDQRRDARDETVRPDVLEWMTDTDLVVLVERLPLAQRQVLLLRYMLDLSFQEIAEVLYRSPEAVRQLHQRALGSLRARLEALGRGANASAPSLRVPMRGAWRPTVAARRDRFFVRQPTLAR